MRIPVIIVLLIAPAFAKAQLKIIFCAGYGTYSMDKLTEFRESVEKNFPVKSKTISSYPAYFNYEGGLVYEFKGNFFAGFIGGYGSSGARSYYSDYSGYLHADHLAKYISLNASVGLSQKLMNEKLLLHFDLRPGVTLTDLDIINKQKIGTQASDQHYEFKSINVVVQPTINATKKFGHLGLNVFAGVNINVICGKLVLNANNDAYLQDDDGNKVTADWTGLRVGAGISYYFWN
jgi:hypothetical protein